MAQKVTNYEGFLKSQNRLYKYGKRNLIYMKNEDQTSLDTVPMCLRGNMATFRIQYIITRKCDEILFQVCELRLLPLS